MCPCGSNHGGEQPPWSAYLAVTAAIISTLIAIRCFYLAYAGGDLSVVVRYVLGAAVAIALVTLFSWLSVRIIQHHNQKRGRPK